MDGSDLSIFIDELNGGASIGETLKFQLVNAFKANLEQERPWVVLRKTDTSKSVTTASTWQSAIDLSTLTRFNRFHGSRPRALAMHKGGVDFDDTNARQLLQNNADAMRILKALERWDAEKQLSEIDEYDSSDVSDDGFRPGAININA